LELYYFIVLSGFIQIKPYYIALVCHALILQEKPLVQCFNIIPLNQKEKQAMKHLGFYIINRLKKIKGSQSRLDSL
jgi:hypothetical protein